MKIQIRSLLILFTIVGAGLTSSTGTRADSLLTLWYDATQTQLSAVDSQLNGIETEMARLEKELTQARSDVASNPECRDLDCAEIQRIAKLIQQVRDAARGAFLLSHIAEQQRSQYADNVKGSISFTSRAANDLASSLAVWELSVLAADLAAVATVAVLTGQPPTSFPEKLAKMGAGIANFAINRQVNGQLSHQDAAGGGLARITGADQTAITNAFARTVGGRMVSVGVLKPVGASFRLEISPRAANLNAAEAAGIVTRAIIHALTDGAVEELRGQVASALRVNQELIRQHRDALMVAGLQKAIGNEIKKRRAKLDALVNRLSTVEGLCSRAQAQKTCGEQLKKLESEANRGHQDDIAAAQSQRDSAVAALNKLRNDWQKAFAETGEAHNALRDALDNESKARQLTAGRSRIELLAKNARDATVREKYRKQLEELDRLGDPATYQASAAKARARRDAAWKRVGELETQISVEREKTLAIMRQSDDAIESAERAAFKRLSAAQQTFLNCIEAARPDMAAVSGPTLASLRQGHPGQLFPDEIFRVLVEKLKTLQVSLSGARVDYSIRPGSRCEEVATPLGGPIHGCWSTSMDSSNDDFLEIRQRGIGLSARLYRRQGGAKVELLETLSGAVHNGSIELNGHRSGAEGRKVNYAFLFKRDPLGLPAVIGGRITPIYTEEDGMNRLPPIHSAYHRVRPRRISAIEARSSDFKSSIKSLRHGNRLYLQAAAEDSCPLAPDNIVLLARPGLNPGAQKLIVLTETEASSGIYRSSADGISLDLFPAGMTSAHLKSFFGGRVDQGAIGLSYQAGTEAPATNIPISQVKLPAGPSVPVSNLPAVQVDPADGIIVYERRLTDLWADAINLR